MKSEITATFFPLYILALVNNNWTNMFTSLLIGSRKFHWTLAAWALLSC